MRSWDWVPAGGPVTGAVRGDLRQLSRAARGRVRTARREETAGLIILERRHDAGDLDQALAIHSAHRISEMRHGAEQPTRIGMMRSCEELVYGRLLHFATRIHHHD